MSRPQRDATEETRPLPTSVIGETVTTDRPVAPAGSPTGPLLTGYEVLGHLGTGGMGVVYRAFDRARGTTVALKTMWRLDASSLYRFKSEFRTLQGVSHPNLVGLHELVSDGHDWFIVMEYVEGVSFLDFVRGAEAPGEIPETQTFLRQSDQHNAVGSAPPPARPIHADRLRHALRQLAEGIVALHDAGKLHRDIKPSNVLVTTEGRVLLLDFGLATEQDAQGRHLSTEAPIVGTFAYMSPEQAAGEPVSPASDWYSVGVMLYEALTGRLPFAGPLVQVLAQKRDADPIPPRLVTPGVPDDLDTLCTELLDRDPSRRPGGREVLDRVGAAPRPTAPAGRPEGSPAATLIGRERHLDELRTAFAGARSGRAVIVHVHGPSGVGKSTLVRRFLDEAEGRAVVLAGRCYERESVPYKALDSLIDHLSRHLMRLSAHEVEAILPRDVAALARAFPVLRRVEAVLHAPRRAIEAPDPQEFRRRAFAALREMLGRMADRRPLVLAIDDMQWSDADSLALLAELLRPPDSPALLLVVCARCAEGAASPHLRAWLGELTGLEVRDLPVTALSHDEAHRLALALLDTTDEARADVIARESGGNPYFVAELARSVPDRSSDGAATLDEVVWRRVIGLPDEARRLLEVVAVSGRPLRATVAGQCLGPGIDERASLALLESARLVRGDGSGEVEAYHDRIRESVVNHLDTKTLRCRHHDLARVLEATGEADPEVVGVHWQGAGEEERAGELFAQAAAQAAEALAFDRAAGLFRLAQELLPRDRPEAHRLRVGLADALANAGRGAESARAYLDAVGGASVAEAFELRRRAAMQLLVSGHIDEGLDALRGVLAEAGLDLPETPHGALIAFLTARLRLRLRGLHFRPRDPSEIAPAELSRVDVCWSAGMGLGNVDWIRGAVFQARGLYLALRAGEPLRIARGLAMEAAHVATAGNRDGGRAERLIGQAASLADATGDPHATGLVELARGVSAYLQGRWHDALRGCDAADAIFGDRCTGVAWERDTAHAFALWALSHLGEWGELRRRFPRLLHEARHRGDLYAAMNLSTYVGSLVRLAADQPDAAREEIRRAMGQWSNRGFHVQHNDQLWAAVQIELYSGDGAAAWDLIDHHWPALRRSLLLRVQFVRVSMNSLRARAALAAARTSDRPEQFLTIAARVPARLARERLAWADAHASAIRAALLQARGEGEPAARAFEEAAARFESCDMRLCAAAARRRAGEIASDPRGEELRRGADSWMRGQSIRSPARIAAMLLGWSGD